MSFGRQPQGYQGQSYQDEANQQQYGQQPFAQQSSIDAQAAYSYDSVQQASRTSITKAYGEMALGLVVTAAVALVT
ncbi:MAG: BAX inhibitor (BI)-1/YccA family protein, partial [Bifidobacterium crudilactis]|nr:BAX inhibitor (BI)-1/YccA family protein [Bifidobacterium crudilactis]